MKYNEISPLRHNFTEVLGSIALVPNMLYFYGKLPENKSKRPKCVAIVGSRKNTKYGEEVAYQAAYELARQGVVVISGLAYGIDSIAHRGALDAGGVTVAVLGTEIDNIYPKNHVKLAERIVENGGAVMSEYAPGVELFSKTSFLTRNRIISGLSDVVLIVEANIASGSLNTAAHALEQGRDLWAVPGPITAPLSQGCNRLLKQGANAYTGVEDLINSLFPARTKSQKEAVFGDNPEESGIIRLIRSGMRDGEEMMTALGVDASAFNRIITLMEIKGIVRGLGANKWTLG
jgi:DNA processing protein